MNTTRANVSIGGESKGLVSELAQAKRRLKTFGADVTDQFERSMRRMRVDAALASTDVNKALSTIALPGSGAKSGRKGGGFMKAAWGAGKGIVGAAASMVGGGLGIQAASGLVGLAGEVFRVEKALTQLQISGEMSNAEIAAFRNRMIDASRATGVATGDIVAGAQSYIALTGDAKGAADTMQLFAEVASGTGASMSDIASTAAALKKNLGIDPKDFRPAFDVLIKQGHQGAVELSDLAQQMANVAPAFTQFAGGKSAQGLAEMGAMLQVVKDNFGSADEAATGFRGVMTEVQRKHKKLEAAGIQVFDPKTGKARNLLEIVKDVGKNAKLMKGAGLLDALGEEKSVRAMKAMIDGMDHLQSLKNESLGSDQTAKDNAIQQASATGRVTKALNEAKLAVQAAFTPERIEAFAKVLTFVVSLLGDIARAAAYVTTSAFDAVEEHITNAMAGSGGGSVQDKLGRASDLGSMTDADLKAFDPTGTADTSRARGAAQKKLYEAAAQQSLGLTPEILAQISAASSYEGAMTKRWGALGGGASGGASTAGIERAIERGLERGLAGATIVAKVDNNQATDAIANAPRQRRVK